MSEAHDAIRTLLSRYCELMDAGDFDGLAELFADGQLSDEEGTVFARGTAEVAKRWHDQTILYDGSPRTRHMTANIDIDIDDTAGHAIARSTYVVVQATKDMSLQPIISGRYVDRFARANDETWRWVERSYAIDHQGDLSQHLRGSETS